MSSNPIQYSKLGEKCLPVGVEIIPNLVCDNDVTGQKVGPDDVWGDVSTISTLSIGRTPLSSRSNILLISIPNWVKSSPMYFIKCILQVLRFYFTNSAFNKK